MNPLAQDLGLVALALARSGVATVREALEMDFGEALVWNLRIQVSTN